MDIDPYRNKYQIDQDLIQAGKVGKHKCPLSLALLTSGFVGEVTVSKDTVVTNQGLDTEQSFSMSSKLSEFNQSFNWFKSGMTRDRSLLQPFTLIMDHYNLTASMEAEVQSCQKKTIINHPRALRKACG